jgi:2-C-methyl-D-erythritol 4-phosphate cytidylyltransferase
MKTSVIIPAAGLGTRVGEDKPKQFIEIDNIPILIRTIRIFDKIDDVESIVIPVHSEWFTYAKELIKQFDCDKVKEITIGGIERQDSVFACLQLKSVKESELVLVHDAVRPFASPMLVQNLINNAEDYGAAIPAIQPIDTIKEKSQKGFVAKTLDRDKLIQVQTPQAFWVDIVTDAYTKASLAGYRGTDSSALVEFIGYKVYVIEGEETNLKITTKNDLRYAESIMK